jgi:hypothetical protein
MGISEDPIALRRTHPLCQCSGNNNIIWRNVNIVDLTITSAVTAELIITNPTDSAMRTCGHDYLPLFKFETAIEMDPSGGNLVKGGGFS